MSDKDKKGRLGFMSKLLDKDGNRVLDENALLVLKNLHESAEAIHAAFDPEEETLNGIDCYPAHTRQLADVIEEFMRERKFKAYHFSTLQLLAWSAHRVVMNMWRDVGRAGMFCCFKADYLELVQEAMESAEAYLKEKKEQKNNE